MQLTTVQSVQLTQVWHALALGDLFFISPTITCQQVSWRLITYVGNQAADLTVLGLCTKAIYRDAAIIVIYLYMYSYTCIYIYKHIAIDKKDHFGPTLYIYKHIAYVYVF